MPRRTQSWGQSVVSACVSKVPMWLRAISAKIWWLLISCTDTQLEERPKKAPQAPAELQHTAGSTVADYRVLGSMSQYFQIAHQCFRQVASEISLGLRMRLKQG